MMKDTTKTVKMAARYVDTVASHSYWQYLEDLLKRSKGLQDDLNEVIGECSTVLPGDDLYWYQQSLNKEIRLIHNLVYRLSLTRVHGHGN